MIIIISVVATGVISSYHLAIVIYDYHNISVVATGVISSYHLTIVIFDYHNICSCNWSYI